MTYSHRIRRRINQTFPKSIWLAASLTRYTLSDLVMEAKTTNTC
jgi:hypothetical protein